MDCASAFISSALALAALGTAATATGGMTALLSKIEM